MAAQKHDIVAISISDPRESVLPDVGLISVEDPETGVRGVIDSGSATVRQAYAERAVRQHLMLQDTVKQTGIDLLELSTGEDYEGPLVKFLT